MAACSTKNQLTLKGSTEILSEFFYFSINSILYQRGIYAPEDFAREPKYGLSMMISKDAKLKQYLVNFLQDFEIWLMKGEVQQLVVVVSGVESGETLERWVFQIEQAIDKENGGQLQEQSTKSTKEITGEISALIRQITATVTFLPMLGNSAVPFICHIVEITSHCCVWADEPCSFDILVYTNKDMVVPVQWQESDPRLVKNAAEVRLRSFDTKIHKVDTAVAYREHADDDV